MTLEIPNKYPRGEGIQEISVTGTSPTASGTHTTPYPITGFISNISIKAFAKVSHTVDTGQGGATINVTLNS